MLKYYLAKDWPYKHCKAKNVWYYSTESFDGGDDCYHYTCRSCGHTWHAWHEND